MTDLVSKSGKGSSSHGLCCFGRRLVAGMRPVTAECASRTLFCGPQALGRPGLTSDLTFVTLRPLKRSPLASDPAANAPEGQKRLPCQDHLEPEKARFGGDPVAGEPKPGRKSVEAAGPTSKT
jgi:hypothetical protein